MNTKNRLCPIALASGLIFVLTPFFVSAAVVVKPTEMTLSGDWSVSVKSMSHQANLTVEPAEVISVVSEKYDTLPLYNEAHQWRNGITPRKTKGAEGFSSDGSLDADSLVVRSGPEDDTNAITFERGADYQILVSWGNLGRLPEGRIKENQPVWLSYRCGWMRLDSVVLSEGKITIRKGTPDVVMPTPPKLAEKEIRIGNIWIRPNREKLDAEMLFPILETKFPEKKIAPGETEAEKYLPKTLAKLKNGEPLKILAWGDSVTDGSYLPNRDDRWQEQFVKQLQKRFPQAKIELITEAWGGRTTQCYFAEPPGSVHNYKEKVLDVKPDLIVSEFVNDAGLNPDGFQNRHERILNDLRGIGAEWIILTPHYVKPGWMGLTRERDIDNDPRPYTQSLRKFGAENNIAVADAAARYGRLWRQGIPYTTLMTNCINHPNAQGMQIFVDALIEVFP